MGAYEGGADVHLSVLAALAGLAAAPTQTAPAPAPPPAASSVVAAKTPRNSWVIVAADANAGTAYDAGSIERAPDGATAYMATMIASKASLSQEGTPVHFVISHNEFDCKQPRRREGAVLGLDAAGKPVGAEETTSEWQAVAPDTAVAGYRALACQGATPDVKIAEGPLKQVIAEFQKRFAK